MSYATDFNQEPIVVLISGGSARELSQRFAITENVDR
jgi:hypothetical protein